MESEVRFSMGEILWMPRKVEAVLDAGSIFNRFLLKRKRELESSK